MKDHPAKPHPQTDDEKSRNMSGAEVIGIIAFAITAIDKSIVIYKAVNDKSGIPERLRKVSDTLPSLFELLESAKAQFDKDHPLKQTWVEVEKDVKRCQESCHELAKDILGLARL